jgi:ribosomal protein S12 methylthiotransferase
MTLQQQISEAKLAKKVGKILDVIVDEVEDNDRIIGRTKGDAPEIDGVIYLHTDKEHTPKPGDILKAKVTANDEYDLEGDILI